MSSLRMLGGGCLVVAFFRAPDAVRMLSLAALVAVASGSVGGEGDTSMTERQSEGEGGLRGRAAELQSRGDAGSNLTYFGHLDQRRSPECCRKAFSIAVEFRVGSACAAGDATCLGVPPSRAHSLPLCSPPPVFQPQKRACASTQNARHYPYVCLHAYTCRCVCICIYVQRKSESKGRMAGVCVVGLNLSPSSTLPPSNLSLSLSLSLSLYTHIHTHSRVLRAKGTEFGVRVLVQAGHKGILRRPCLHARQKGRWRRVLRPDLFERAGTDDAGV